MKTVARSVVTSGWEKKGGMNRQSTEDLGMTL